MPSINSHKIFLRFIPNATAETEDAFRKLLDGLNVVRFGAFSVFKSLRLSKYTEIEHLNISEIAEFVSKRKILFKL